MTKMVWPKKGIDNLEHDTWTMWNVQKKTFVFSCMMGVVPIKHMFHYFYSSNLRVLNLVISSVESLDLNSM
jgi:hypothetical protein